jgi:hypothetical protein
MAAEPRAAGEAPRARGLAPLLAVSLALGVGCLALAWREWPHRNGHGGNAFLHLFARDELAAAILLVALVAVAPLVARVLSPRLLQLPARLGRPRAVNVVAGVTVAVVALGAHALFGARPLTMDEYAPWFQARVFAAGHLAGRLPPELLPRLVPERLLFPFFAVTPATGAVVSTYWPGFALLLVPFTWLGAPWLLNPLLAGGSLVLIASLARRWTGTTAAAGWTLLFALASPAFTVNAASFYPLTAHLALGLAFAALLVEGRSASESRPELTTRPARLLAAGAVGSVALVLANPVPRAVFALPWIAALVRRRGVRALALLALGYAPLTLVLGVAWLSVRVQAPHVGGAFAVPGSSLLYARLLALVELVTWAAPFLPVVAVAGWRLARRGSPLRLLAGSALALLAVYCFVPFDQGHGWGYRYVHPAWSALPLLAAACLVDARWMRWRAPVLAALLLAIPASNALRAVQARSFVAEQRARAHELPSPLGDRRHLRFISLAGGDFRVDLLQNDPFLRDPVVNLASEGFASDAALVARIFPGARLVSRSSLGSVWELPPSP